MNELKENEQRKAESIIENTKSMAALTYTMQALNKTVEAMQENVNRIEQHNRESHKRLWDKNDEQDKTLNDHEHRLKVIEDEREQ